MSGTDVEMATNFNVKMENILLQKNVPCGVPFLVKKRKIEEFITTGQNCVPVILIQRRRSSRDIQSY